MDELAAVRRHRERPQHLSVRSVSAAGDHDATRVLIREFLGAVAQFEKSVIVSKPRAARVRTRRETGRCEGRKPFGTRPGEAEILTLMKRLRRKPKGGERLSFDAIADRLNATGVPTRTGARWRGPTVHGILKRAGGGA